MHKFHLLAVVPAAIVFFIINSLLLVSGQECESGEIILEGSELECGEAVPKVESHQRIIGGSEAYPGQFPFTVAIRIHPFKDAFQCGGSIIDERHIITAAHCFDSLDPSVYNIAIGAYKRKSHAHDCRIEMDVEKVFVHELYASTKNKEVAAYDIAMIRTKEPIKFKLTADGYGSVNRICLPPAGKRYKVGQQVTLSGWGHLGQRYFRDANGQCDRKTASNSKPVEMQTTTFKIVPSSSCVSKLRPIHFCLNSNALHTQAAGDSGSPYMEYINGKAVQVGIVSGQDGDPRSPNCERITAHAVKVSAFIDWIREKIATGSNLDSEGSESSSVVSDETNEGSSIEEE